MLLEVSGLSIDFKTATGSERALNSVNYSLKKGSTLAIVGESGSGKTVSTLCLTGLLPTPPAHIREGQIMLHGKNLLTFSRSRLREISGKKISYVFQEHSSSLNPVLTIGEQIAEVLKIHTKLNAAQRKERTVNMLKKVGIANAEDRYNDYPHQFSGGMKQRVVIAMALVCHPEIVIADEPTTALDVTMQAQILELLKNLQEQTGMSIILITHSLAAAQIADDVLVLYGGEVMEYAPAGIVFKSHRHPYTQGLLNSLPPLSKKLNRLSAIKGNPGEKAHKGCVFSLRCDKVFDKCKEVKPELINCGGHYVKCHLYSDETCN